MKPLLSPVLALFAAELIQIALGVATARKALVLPAPPTAGPFAAPSAECAETGVHRVEHVRLADHGASENSLCLGGGEERGEEAPARRLSGS